MALGAERAATALHIFVSTGLEGSGLTLWSAAIDGDLLTVVVQARGHTGDRILLGIRSRVSEGQEGMTASSFAMEYDELLGADASYAETQLTEPDSAGIRWLRNTEDPEDGEPEQREFNPGLHAPLVRRGPAARVELIGDTFHVQSSHVRDPDQQERPT